MVSFLNWFRQEEQRQTLDFDNPHLQGFAIPLWSFIGLFALFSILKALKKLRVEKEEEVRGLDISEHGEEAYHGFQIFTTD
jgi:ammonia channel protein AmtB